MENKRKINKKASNDNIVDLTEEEIIEGNESKKMKEHSNSHLKVVGPVVCLSIVAATLAIVLPLTLIHNNIDDSLPSTIVKDPEVLGRALTQNKVNKLAFEATTAFQSAFSSGILVNKAINLSDKTELEEFLPLVDLILTNKSNFTTTLIESTKEDYSFELEVKYEDVVGNQFSHQMFFNVLKSEVEKDDDEIETSIYYSGITNLYGDYLEFVGKLEEETENDESESEISLVLYLNSTKTNYVEVVQSSEFEESGTEEKFEFEVWNKGVKEKDFSIETEINGGQTSIDLEIDKNDYFVEIIDSDGSTLFKFTKQDSLKETVIFKKIIKFDSELGSSEVSYKEVTV